MEAPSARRAPGRRKASGPADIDGKLEAWIDAWQPLIAELEAARWAGITAGLRARSRAAQAIVAANPALDWPLMNLDKRQGEAEFRRVLGSLGGWGSEFNRAWLARMRQDDAYWQEVPATEDWSGAWVPNARILSGLPCGEQEYLRGFLWSLRGAKPSGKWAARAREIASGRNGRRIRRAIIDWLETLPVAKVSSELVRNRPDLLCFRSFRRYALEDIERTGSPEAAALLAFFTPPFPLWTYWSWGLRDPAILSEGAARLVRAAAWMLTNWRDEEVVAALRKSAEATLMRVAMRGGGVEYRSLLAANTCILALGEIASPEAVQALGRIKLGIRDERLSKQIAAAMEAAAARAGMTVEDLEELSAPDLGLGEVGVKSLRLGDFSATLRVVSTTRVDVALARSDGRPVKTVPAAIKADKESRAALKELKELGKTLAQALPVHRQRIESLYLAKRSWPLAVWRERFLDHPVVGTIARRLIWNVAGPGGEARSFLWPDGAPINSRGRRAAGLRDDDIVTLWHPLDARQEDVALWRAFLMERKLVQPFKQAHREVYPLTDAERAIGLYSNRFAGHILRQHQSVALARRRGWRATLRICADVPNDQPTHVRMRDYGLAAELWTEAAGGIDAEVTDTGAYVFISTDRVRFRRLTTGAEGREELGEPVPLEAVPPRLFSEVMRDVDLFIGVASIGNDPYWTDRGADAEHPNQWRNTARIYWEQHANAPLVASGENRREILAEIIPSLAIAERCSFSDRHLVVRGNLRTYRIHLGSANVFRDDDVYLCIVPRSGPEAWDTAFFPFEGDRLLSVILSKALMLASDDRITDPSILSQLRK
ncbi:MAG: DUF4132 domain-containing protein [Rhodospirillales bacterium]|nr:DUF4132 domain-containing protein [Rhodospirillales bacterium]